MQNKNNNSPIADHINKLFGASLSELTRYVTNLHDKVESLEAEKIKLRDALKLKEEELAEKKHELELKNASYNKLSEQYQQELNELFEDIHAKNQAKIIRENEVRDLLSLKQNLEYKLQELQTENMILAETMSSKNTTITELQIALDAALAQQEELKNQAINTINQASQFVEQFMATHI